jgi:hypothetical protein
VLGPEVDRGGLEGAPSAGPQLGDDKRSEAEPVAEEPRGHRIDRKRRRVQPGRVDRADELCRRGQRVEPLAALRAGFNDAEVSALHSNLRVLAVKRRPETAARVAQADLVTGCDSARHRRDLLTHLVKGEARFREFRRDRRKRRPGAEPAGRAPLGEFLVLSGELVPGEIPVGDRRHELPRA